MKKRTFFAIFLVLASFMGSYAVEITVFGRGGIRGNRICPKSCAACVCAEIKTFHEELNIGDVVDVDVFSVNGSTLFTGSGIFLGMADQGADVDFGTPLYIDDPNDPE